MPQSDTKDVQKWWTKSQITYHNNCICICTSITYIMYKYEYYKLHTIVSFTPVQPQLSKHASKSTWDFWGWSRTPAFAPSHALALLQALIAAWQICSSHGWSFHPPKNQTQVGHKKENIKVNPGGVGGCTHPFGSQTFGEILKWIFYKKRGISYDMKIWLKPPPSWKWTNRFTWCKTLVHEH